MADYTESGSISIAGLSGTDFTEMIDALKKIELKHANQLARWRDDWAKRLDAFGQLRTALTEFSSFMKTINTEDKFLVKSVAVSNPTLCSVTDTVGAMDGSYQLNVTSLATNSYLTVEANVNKTTDKISDSSGNFIYQYDKDGDGVMEDYSIAVSPDTTLQGLVNLINSDKNNPGVSATIMEMGGKYYFQMYSKESGAGTDIKIKPSTFIDGMKGFQHQTSAGPPPVMAPNTWIDKSGTDAKFQINGQDLTSSSNNFKVYGMEMNLTDVGAGIITTGTDKKAMKENVEKFVEEINKVRSLMVSLTSVNENKVQKDPEYATSQFDMQMGSVLTGNYGVQLLKSMFNSSTISQGLGFEYLNIDETNGTFTGDMFSSLAQIGIKTDHQVGSPTFGQLIFEDNPEMMTLEKALNESPWGVAELFSANKKTYCDTNKFVIMDENSLMMYVDPGKYDVKYQVASDGTVSEFWINGEKAKKNEVGLWGLPGTSTNAARGLLFMVNDTTPNAPGDWHTGVARVKSGKLTELIDQVDQDFLRAYNSKDKENNGTLSILEEQYKEIIANIEKKIMKEDERIIKWERNTRLRFSRLEKVLKQYEGLQTQLESQLKQLNTNSSSK